MPERFHVSGRPILDWKGTDRLRRFRKFCREYVVIPDGHNAGRPMELYPAQVEWVKSIIHADATVITIGKGNAKSSTMGAVCFWWAVDPPPGDENSEIVIVAGSKDQARQGVYSTVLGMLELSPLEQGWDYYSYVTDTDTRVEFRNGSTIRVRSAHPGRLHGIRPSLSCLDEIGLVENPLVWNTLVQSLGKRPVTRVVGIGTPGWIRGTLFDMKVAHDSGLLPKHIAFHEYAADPWRDADDRKAWRQANPVRAAMDPDSWEHTLETVRAMPTVSEADFRLFHLCQWPDLRGAPVITADDWDRLRTEDRVVPDVVHVAIDGDWQRRNVAAMAAVVDDGRVDLLPLGIWENQNAPVPPEDIAEAVMSLDAYPVSVTVGRSMMAAELVEALEDLGCAVEELNTSSAASMRDPTDRLLAALSSGRISHDGTEALRAQVLGARQDVRKDGVTFVRDDRIQQRIDALVAGAVAHHAAVASPVPMVY